MDKDQQIAYLNAQVACMLVELAAMQAHDRDASVNGTGCYTEQVYLDLPNRYGVHHNAVVGLFKGLFNG